MIKKKLTVMAAIFAALWSAVAVRLFVVQVWSSMPNSDGFASRESLVLGPRGAIYDRNGAVLAMSRKVVGIFIDAKLAAPAGASALAEKLSRYAQVSPSEISAMVRTGKKYIPLEMEFDIDEAERIKSEKIPGIGFEERVRRVYPEGDLARQMLGVCSQYSKTGVELAYDKYLSGSVVQIKKQRDGAGRSIPEDFYFEQLVKGGDVYLTIDKNIQYIAEKTASDSLISCSAKRVVIIVQDPVTGELLALATKEKEPSFRISSISEVFEPGSTFKVFTYALAFDEGAVREDELIFCENGKYRIYNEIIRDHEKKSTLTVRQAFAYSSNIACAKISQKISREKLHHAVRNFGFGTLSGINLPGEEKGLMPRRWDPFTSMTVSFGQGIGVTPLQVANAYSALANGGWLLEPQIVKKIVPGNARKPVYESARKVVRRVAGEKTVETLKDMLGDVVSYGTGQYSTVAGYRVGGKTGTAQKIDPATGKYSKQNYVSSFCGILPLDAPRLTVFVMVDSPGKGDYWGGTVAAPVFARVASLAAAYMRIPPSGNADNLASLK